MVPKDKPNKEFKMTDIMIEILGEFDRVESRRVNFVGKSEAELDASEWVVSDEIRNSRTWDALDEMEMDGILYCLDDDYYHLTAKGLEIYKAFKILGRIS